MKQFSKKPQSNYKSKSYGLTEAAAGHYALYSSILMVVVVAVVVMRHVLFLFP